MQADYIMPWDCPKSLLNRVTDSTPPPPQDIQGELDSAQVIFRAPFGSHSTRKRPIHPYGRCCTVSRRPWAGWVLRSRM